MSALSYVHGSHGVPLTELSIGAFLDQVAASHGHREAVVSFAQGIRWSYSQLKQQADHVAAGLLSLGLLPGERIGIWSPNRAEWTAIQFASAKAGLILVNINPAYRVTELEHVLKASGCKALFTASRFKSSDYIEMLDSLVANATQNAGRLDCARLPELRYIITLDEMVGLNNLTYREILKRGEQLGVNALADLSEIGRAHV